MARGAGDWRRALFHPPGPFHPFVPICLPPGRALRRGHPSARPAAFFLSGLCAAQAEYEVTSLFAETFRSSRARGRRWVKHMCRKIGQRESRSIKPRPNPNLAPIWFPSGGDRLRFRGERVAFDGGRTRIRTLDPLIKSQLLYQLSYAPVGAAI
jgi:hypothetical protein